MGTNYKHLSCEERTMIQLSLEQGCTLPAIASFTMGPPRFIVSKVSHDYGRSSAFSPGIRLHIQIASAGKDLPQANHRIGI